MIYMKLFDGLKYDNTCSFNETYYFCILCFINLNLRYITPNTKYHIRAQINIWNLPSIVKFKTTIATWK